MAVSGALVFLILLVYASTAAESLPFKGFESSPAPPINFKVSALADREQILPGEGFHLHVVITLAEGWHIYSMKTEGGGREPLATRIVFSENVFVPEGEWQEPAPEIVFDGALQRVVKTHSRRVEFRRSLKVPRDLPPGEYEMIGAVHYRACDNKRCTLPRDLGFKTRILVTLDAP